MTINFKAPEIRELKPRILVLGVGGAGGNAINEMIESGVEGVEFIAVNTDAQDLKTSKAHTRIQIGLNITKGLIFSQEVMLELTKSGLSREKSYKMVQNYAKICFAENLNLFDLISDDKFIMSKISSKKLKKIFNFSSHFKNVDLNFRRVFR